MKLKDKVQILMDNDTIKTVKGTNIHYKQKGLELDLLVHMTESIWKEGTVEVSEKTTGCRLFSMPSPLQDIKEADVLRETENFIKEKGKDKLLKRIEEKRPLTEILDKTK